MHLGMSGSFRVGKDGAEAMPGDFQYERSKAAAHDHVVFHMSSGASVTFNDPRRFGFMKLVPRVALDQEPLLRSIGPEPLGNEFGAALLARACRGKKTSLKAALERSARRRGARKHLCLRGAATARDCRPSAAPPPSPRKRRAERARGCARRCDQGGAQRRDQGRRLVAARSSPHRRRDSATSSIRSASTTARARNVRRAAARARSGGSCRPAARRFSVRSARSKSRLGCALASRAAGARR